MKIPGICLLEFPSNFDLFRHFVSFYGCLFGVQLLITMSSRRHYLAYINHFLLIGVELLIPLPFTSSCHACPEHLISVEGAKSVLSDILSTRILLDTGF